MNFHVKIVQKTTDRTWIVIVFWHWNTPIYWLYFNRCAAIKSRFFFINISKQHLYHKDQHTLNWTWNS